MRKITYRKRKKYKYRLAKPFDLTLTTLHPIAEDIKTPFITLKTNGTLIIQEDYTWDGPSGPAPDWSSLMRGSLVHDALYQLLREKKLERSQRAPADKILKSLCIEDGLAQPLAHVVWLSVRLFGIWAASQRLDRIEAPRPWWTSLWLLLHP